MKNAVIYVHGKGGSAEEADHYQTLFRDSSVIGFDYKAQAPWEAKEEFSIFFDDISCKHQSITVIANSIGAFFAMEALSDKRIKKAFFISPIVNMEKLICDMMLWANVTEEELSGKGEIKTAFGGTLSWEYLCYVRENPIRWQVPTHILYGSRDNLTAFNTVSDFAVHNGATLTVMENGEHWFHTEEQMKFLDDWILRFQ